jgi:hypothetical protein
MGATGPLRQPGLLQLCARRSSRIPAPARRANPGPRCPAQAAQVDEEAARQQGMAAMSETFRHKGAQVYLEEGQA